jgi:hypothetical protein
MDLPLDDIATTQNPKSSSQKAQNKLFQRGDSLHDNIVQAGCIRMIIRLPNWIFLVVSGNECFR